MPCVLFEVLRDDTFKKKKKNLYLFKPSTSTEIQFLGSTVTQRGQTVQRVYVEIIAFFSVSLCRGALVLFFLFKSKHISDFCFNAADLDSNWDYSCRPGITRTFQVDFVLFRLIFLFLFLPGESRGMIHIRPRTRSPFITPRFLFAALFFSLSLLPCSSFMSPLE